MAAIYQLQSFRRCPKDEEQPKHKRSWLSSSLFLQKEVIGDPSWWRDNCPSKLSSKNPDSRLKGTKESLWVHGLEKPSCVQKDPLSQVYARSTQELGQKWTDPATVPLTNRDEGAAFVALLKDCTRNKNLYLGTRIHDDIVKKGLLERCSDALVTMYAKCGELGKAKVVLEMHDSMDVVTWNALITGYARLRQGQNTLDCFECMECEGISPNAVTFACALKACGMLGDLDKGKAIHEKIKSKGLLKGNVVLGTALVDMYAKCGYLSKAQDVLEKLPFRDVVSWSALIAGYAQKGQGEQALKCFESMKREGVTPNAVTYVCILRACANSKCAEKGKEIHDEIVEQGYLRNNLVLGAALIDMYAKCGLLSKAQDVLEHIPSRDVVCWNALVAGYAHTGQGEQALNCFECMKREDVWPDAVTYACILKACASIGATNEGKKIHDEVAKQGLLQNDIVLGTALVDMYAKCGAVSKAQDVLESLPSRDVVCWNALIAGYAQEGQGWKALNCYERLQHEGILPDAVTHVSILQACGSLGDIVKGREIHGELMKQGIDGELMKQGLLQNNVALGTALVDMYAKCGALMDARNVLAQLNSRGVISWSALIIGYAQDGQGEEAVNCFEQMKDEGIHPDAVTYACVLKACASIGALDMAEQIHDEVAKQGFLQKDMVLGTALLDMYAKCGTVSMARHLLEELPSRDVVSWNALVAGYAQEGQGEQAVGCFKRMQREGIHPNAVTFVSMLNLYSHLGLLEDGHMLFANMITKYGVNPNLECYTCMIDLFGRAGHLEKAVRLIQEMPLSDNSAIWFVLLGACQKWGDVYIGRWAFKQAVHVNKSEGPAYVLLANMYAAAVMQENIEGMESIRFWNCLDVEEYADVCVLNV